MSTANGGSLDDCITNLFALTELSGLQWRQYESPVWDGDTTAQNLLEVEPILVAYSKLQTDGILSAWRRMPKKVIPPVFDLLPTLQASAPKELWVFWYGSTEPEEIEKHCKDLVKKKSEEEQDDGTMSAIPYDVRCLLYKSWNSQLERKYRNRNFLQVGRWFFKPHKFLDPNSVFSIDDFALAFTHSFNIVGGNSMCLAIKVQLQPNLVLLSPFHLERNRKFRDTKISVVLAPWSLKGQISLRYLLVANSKREEEEVESQLSQWKISNMYADAKKKKKRRREEGGEAEGEESEDEGWGETKMPKMIRVEVEGNIRMWWPTQYVLVTLEETRRLVRQRFPVDDHIKAVPAKKPRSWRNRFGRLTSSDSSLRISQPAIDNGNFKREKEKPKAEDDDDTIIYSIKQMRSDGRENRTKRRGMREKKKEVVAHEERDRRKAAKALEAAAPRVVRLSSVSDDEMEEDDPNKDKRRDREMERIMIGDRYNWRTKKSLVAPNSKEKKMKAHASSYSDGEEEEKRLPTEDEKGGEWKGFRSPSFQRRPVNKNADEERFAKFPFTPVRVNSPFEMQSEMDQMKDQILVDMAELGETIRGADLNPEDFLNMNGAYYNYHAAKTTPNINYKAYHIRRQGNQRTPAHLRPKSMLEDYEFCSSDEDYGDGTHVCSRRRETTPEPMKPPRPPHVIPNFDTMVVGGVNGPPVYQFNPDMVIQPKSTAVNPPRNPIEWTTSLGERDDSDMEMDDLKYLEDPGKDLGSDEEDNDDVYSTGSAEGIPPFFASLEDAGEGTSSVAENWKDYEEMETEEDFTQQNMDSSTELMDTDGLPLHSDSVLSPPASNERADSNNSMYHRLPGGPHSVGDTALNKIYPTPPSLLQVDICSPAMMGGPHSQARKEEREDGSSSHDEEEGTVKYLDGFELKDEDIPRGSHEIKDLHYQLPSRHFYDKTAKAEVPVSNLFGFPRKRLRVPEKRTVPVYNTKDGERKEQLAPRHAKVLAAVDSFKNSRAAQSTSASTTSGGVGGGGGQQSWQSHQQQPYTHPSLAPHPLQQQQHQSQPGPSMTQPSIHPSMPVYMGSQMGGVYPGQPGGMRSQYLPTYGTAVQQQGMQQQPGFAPQSQPQYMGGGQMMMGGQSGYNPAMAGMRPPTYPGYGPQGTGSPMGAGGMHGMQGQGMTPQQMAYQQGMQNQMMYRQGMPQGSYPPQYGSPMGGMMAPTSTMGGMQMGQYGQMQQGGMMMQPQQHQPMIAGAPHPMGMGGMGGVHPSFPMGVVPTPPSSVSIVPAQSAVAVAKKIRPVIACPIDEERALVAARRGEDPYVNSLAIAPRKFYYKGKKQMINEFDLYTTERILDKARKRGDRALLAPVGGSEGLSIVAVVMLQDTILNLHFDWVFDSCPICSCTTSIRSRELGVYIRPPEILEEPLEVQSEWIGPWNGFHSEVADATCTCGFSVIRHRQLSMKAGLFLEDSKEATGDENSGTTPLRGKKSLPYVWFDPSSTADHALVETLRSIALTTDLGRIVASIKHVSSIGNTRQRKTRRRRRNAKIPSLGAIGSSRVEYVISQMDKMELLLMGNSALNTAHTNGNKPSPSVGDYPYFHPWGLQIASEVADPTEAEIKNLLDDVKPMIEGAVREARKLPSSYASSVIEGPLTWRALAAKNVKSSGSGEDDSHIAEPIPLIEMSTDKDAIRVAPTVLKNWEQFNLGPIDVSKDVLYLAVVPDDDRVAEMTLVYMRRMSKMYETNLRLGRHVAYLTKDSQMRSPVREGIVRASGPRSHYNQYGAADSPSLIFVKTVEKYAAQVGCSKEFISKLMSYVMCMEEVLFEHLKESRPFDRDAFRECLTYALWHRRTHQKQKSTSNPAIARHEKDTEDGSPLANEEEDKKGDEGARRKESDMFKGPLAEAMGMAPGSSKAKKAKRPFGQSPPYSMDGERVFKQIDWPEDDPAALPQTVVVYLTLWPCWGSEGRDGEAARVATLAIVKAFNAVMKKLPSKHRGVCQLELIPLQRLEEVVGNGVDLDRLDRSNNLNTWQIGNMNRNAEVFPTDRPRMEDVLKEMALGIYRKPRFLHCDSLKSCLPKSMTKFGPASATLEWIEKKDGKKKMLYKCPSVPFQLANTPAVISKNENKCSQLVTDEISLYISYCLVATDFIVVTVTDHLGARADSAVLNLKPKSSEIGSTFRSRNKTTVRDGLDKLWRFIEGVMLNESKPIRLVIGKLGKMGHGEFKAWCHVLNKGNLEKYATRLREQCPPCNVNAGSPALLSACLVSTEPEAHLQVLPSYSLPPDPSTSAPKKIRPLHTPGDNTITHIMVFPVSPAIQLTQSADMGGVDNDDDDFGLGLGEGDVNLGLDGDDGMNNIMNELMSGDADGEGKAGLRNQQMNSFFDGTLDSLQNQPLAAGWSISTAPAGDLPDWFWSSCPSLKRRLPVHLRSSLHINETQLRSDDLGVKKDKDESCHALDSKKTDEVLRHVLEQYNDLSWLAIDSITQERRSCLPVHIQALTRLHDTVLNLIM